MLSVTPGQPTILKPSGTEPRPFTVADRPSSCKRDALGTDLQGRPALLPHFSSVAGITQTSRFVRYQPPRFMIQFHPQANGGELFRDTNLPILPKIAQKVQSRQKSIIETASRTYRICVGTVLPLRASPRAWRVCRADSPRASSSRLRERSTGRRRCDPRSGP